MILLKDVVGWLNQFDPSHLDSVAQESVNHFLTTNLSEKDFDDHRKKAVRQAERSVDPLMLQEVMVRLGEAYDARGKKAETLAHFNEAHAWYENQGQDHRAAVTAWLAGIIAWELRQNNYAYTHWKKAVRSFEQLSGLARHWRASERVNWYQARLHLMRVELAKTAEEGKAWLDVFGKTAVNPEIRALTAQMESDQRRGRYASVQETIRMLENFRPDLSDALVLPEILLDAGLAFHQMQAFALAKDYLMEAGARFHPGSHRAVVANWMLGAVLWQMPEARSEAMVTWMKAIQGFEGLQREKEKDHNSREQTWYEETLKITRQAADEKLKGL